MRSTTILLLACLCFGCEGLLDVDRDPNDQPSPDPVADPDPELSLDLSGSLSSSNFLRVSGSASTGGFGVPVAAGFDCDGDGVEDFAMSAMQAAPFGRTGAGQVHLVFGDGSIDENIDTANASARVLVIAGSAVSEAAGSEIWMDDVTGDGVGDLLIARQNYRDFFGGDIGAGALTIIVGGAQLRSLANSFQILDLANPPFGLRVLTVVGENELDRLGMWMRTGDVTGDGIADILVGADQADIRGERNSGVAYLIRGGAHLDGNVIIKLGSEEGTSLGRQVAQIRPPETSEDFHFGATVAIGDLDDNGRGEVLISASLSRVGGLLVADGANASSAVRNGGNSGGSLFILWDDNFSATLWPNNFIVAYDDADEGKTRIDGGTIDGLFTNVRFGEDVLGGKDFDNDGRADLFSGDIKGVAGDLIDGGVGHVFFNAASLRDREFSMSSVPSDIVVTHLIGPEAGSISSDTSAAGDFNGDGIDDLAVSSPLANPSGRVQAGTVHVLWGTTEAWPAVIDFADGQRPDPAVFAITDIYGANGDYGNNDAGDTLMYSAATGDLNDDGVDDLVINEMRGNGVANSALDVGNLIVISGTILPTP